MAGPRVLLPPAKPWLPIAALHTGDMAVSPVYSAAGRCEGDGRGI